MKVICAGFGRTGTLSLRYALEKLGIPCYHNNDMEDWHYEDWTAMIEHRLKPDGTRTLDPAEYDFSEMFHRPRGWFGCASGGSKIWNKGAGQGHYEACSDFPMCLFYKELLQQWPNAKVVLTYRDTDGWMKSFQRMMSQYFFLLDLFSGWGDMDQRLNIGKAYKNEAERATGLTGKYWESFEVADKWQKDHIAEVKAHMKAIGKEDQLLVYSVKQGWGPLCKFLGKEAPTGSFPRVNSKLTAWNLVWLTIERIIKAEKWNILWWLVCMVMVCFAVFAYFFLDMESFTSQILEVF